jgi:hypothetical protein
MHYRKIYESKFGKIPKDKNGRSYEIHHIDGNHNNNSLDNLICVSIEEHYKIHLEQGDFNAANLIADRIKSPNLKIKGFKKVHSEETKLKIKNTLLGRKRPTNVRKNISNGLKGRKLSESHIQNFKFRKNNTKKVIDIVTGVIYDTVNEAANMVGIKRTTLIAKLTGQNKNNTNLKYYNYGKQQNDLS